MRKKVVYTSIVGEFDQLLQPLSIDNTFDYVCFVKKGQTIKGEVGVWNIREIPFEHESARLLSRFPKLLPHKVLPDYDYSLWIDGNVTIKTSEIYDIINRKIEECVLYSGLNHWSEDCAYEDAALCIDSGKDTLSHVLRTISFLKKKHFPKHWGLFENNVIFRAHHASKVVNFDELWWELLNNYPNRDQLIHPYSMMVSGLSKNYLLPKEYCARNHSTFLYMKHVVKIPMPKGFNRIVQGIIRKSKVSIVRLYCSI